MSKWHQIAESTLEYFEMFMNQVNGDGHVQKKKKKKNKEYKHSQIKFPWQKRQEAKAETIF